MPELNMEAARGRLQAFAFEELFVEELGWNRFGDVVTVTVDDAEYTLTSAAQKRGFVVFVCEPGPEAPFPLSEVRRKIEAQAARYAREHLIIFVDRGRTRQVWQWVRRDIGQPIACREFPWQTGQNGDSILQRLREVGVSMEEEDDLTIVDVAGRVRKAFDVDKVTRRFYDRFKDRRNAFAGAISGIADRQTTDWYASVLLNRLMFVYFIQKKGFLDRDTDYLSRKLGECQARFGGDRFYSFYRTFLLRFFHEGLGSPRHDWPEDLRDLVGNVPYLNGGIFLPHPIESEHPDIAIPDSAFTELFAFFDEYRWHLDERPNRDDREINPDVLGYIFEKYINQKEMGAYYTREDITEYIGRSAILPRVFDMAAERCAVAFEEGGPVWSLLSSDPDRYIFEPVRRGVVVDGGGIVPESDLPDFVQEGMHNARARMFDQRYNLGDAQLHDTEGRKLTLPTETWREYVERRKRCLELRATLGRAEVHEVNDLITLNLDLRQLAEDAIGQCGPDLLMAFWRAITSVTVLDPTAGSGAFLFAALNILVPLYEACLDKMEALIGDQSPAASPATPPAPGRSEAASVQPYPEFESILARVAEHPNRRYYILKTIIVNNLFGVDIMQEAVEICKLRLFLKLAAQLDRVDQIEPLPDIDFNIRCGNTLVGYARIKDIDRLWYEAENVGGQQKLFTERDHTTLKAAVDEYGELLTCWRGGQLGHAASRPVTREHLDRARDEILPELDADLRRLYRTAMKLPDHVTIKDFRRTHQPFHWFVEFPQAMAAGGFDVVIGNPPYVSATAPRSYDIVGYATRDCPDIYAWCLERCCEVERLGGRVGAIIPISAQFSTAFGSMRELLETSHSSLHVSAFSRNPSALFSAGLGVRSTILIGKSGDPGPRPVVYTSRLHRWIEDYRDVLFRKIEYTQLTPRLRNHAWPRPDSADLAHLFDELLARDDRLHTSSDRGSVGLRFKSTALYYISAFAEDPPSFDDSGHAVPQTKVGCLHYGDRVSRDRAAAIALSKIALLWWAATGDDFDVTASGLGSTPISATALSPVAQSALDNLASKLLRDMHKNIIYTRYAGKVMGNYDVKQLRDTTDQVDLLLLEDTGLTRFWDAVQLGYARFMKMTGERPGTTRGSRADT